MMIVLSWILQIRNLKIGDHVVILNQRTKKRLTIPRNLKGEREGVKMFKIKVNPKIIEYCEKQIKEHNFGQRGYADGTPEQQLTGIIGQSVIMHEMVGTVIDGSEGFDGGVDIVYEGKTIDVKTMGRTTDVRDYYTNNFLAVQMKFNPDVYIFCSYNKNKQELTVCGWITSWEFKEIAHYYEKGSTRKRSDGSTFKTFADLYEIDNKDLNQVKSIDDLKEQLKINENTFEWE